MKKVFEPGEVELADPRGDPNRVIDIQKKIKELLETNAQRQQGIIDEIKEEGAWALPGLLNSTYVWTNNFEDNKPAQKTMAGILADVARENDLAEALLFEFGVLENPFKTSREIAMHALEVLNWKPSSAQIATVNIKIQEQKKLDDIEGLMLSYQVLARSGDKNIFNSMLKQCMDWSVLNTGDAASLLGLLVKYYPEFAVDTLSNVFVATKRMYREKKLAEYLVKAIRPIPSKWWLDSTIVNISIKVLAECIPPRHTCVEYLWKYAAQDAKNEDAQFWTENKGKVNTLLFHATEHLNEDISETITRYWFQSLGNIPNAYDLLVEAALSEFEPWGTSAALQLFFLQGEQGKNRKHKDLVETALNRLMSENSSRYERAESKYESISSKNKDDTEIKPTSKAAGLTDH